jgi:hypothetical protein
MRVASFSCPLRRKEIDFSHWFLLCTFVAFYNLGLAWFAQESGPLSGPRRDGRLTGRSCSRVEALRSSTPLGRGAHVRVAVLQSQDEQGLRKTMRNGRGVRIRCRDALDGEVVARSGPHE